MRAGNVFRVLLLSAILCGLGQTAAGKSSAQAEVFAALAEQDKAFFAGDEATVGRIKSDDYLQTDVRGVILDKRAWFKEYFGPLAPYLKSGKTRFSTFERSDIVVRDFGDTVVVAGKLRLKYAGVNPWDPKVNYQPGPPRVISFTQVWIKRGGVWKEAVLHNAYLEDSNPAPAGHK